MIGGLAVSISGWPALIAAAPANLRSAGSGAGEDDGVGVALAAAQIDGSPLANRPDLLRRAATEIGAVKDDATPDDVIIYAAGLAAAVA
ncbi:MAG: hypothetical protein ACRD0K_00705 [Egibacteraceae bacterium]